MLKKLGALSILFRGCQRLEQGKQQQGAETDRPGKDEAT